MDHHQFANCKVHHYFQPLYMDFRVIWYLLSNMLICRSVVQVTSNDNIRGTLNGGNFTSLRIHIGELIQLPKKSSSKENLLAAY